MSLRRPRPTTAALLALAPFVVLVGLACGPGEAKTPGDGAARVVHQLRDDRFLLTVETLGAGPRRRVRAEVVPRGDYHLSLEYPSRFELAGHPVAGREDAAHLGPGRLAFDTELPQSTAAGRVEGRVRFGICLREELCEAVDHEFEAVLN